MTLMSDNIWAMETQALRRYFQRAQNIDLSSIGAVQSRGVQTSSVSSTAVIPIRGPMVKSMGIIEEILGFSSTSMLQDAIEQAASDREVTRIVLAIDSPGGSVSGLSDLSDAVFNARQKKQVIAQVDGMAASAAFHVASQASEIRLGREDMVGSIGVKLVLYDMSRLFEHEGVETVAIDTGEFKSAGEPGTPITENQRRDFQRLVDQFMDGFINAVMRGRSMSEAQVKEVADGRVFVGHEAVRLGLADSVQTLKETLGSSTERFNAMTNTFYEQMGIKAGESLAQRLNDAIDAIDEDGNDDRSRSDVIEQMARGANLSTSTVNSILNAEINCPPLRRLRGFATVEGIPSFREQRQAAEQDGCEYGENGEEFCNLQGAKARLQNI